MTGQIGDKYRYSGEDYTIVAISPPIEFDPVQYGITPAAANTACWAGYWCEYDISDSGIVLSNLYVNARDANYPPINGVSAQAEPSEESFAYMGHHLYEGIDIPMDYTGRIVAGAGFLREYYIHMGYQRAWAYETLIEFVFENGRLIETVDHSFDAAKIREGILDNPDGLNGRKQEDIEKFVADSFSLDYRVKLWWLDILE